MKNCNAKLILICLAGASTTHFQAQTTDTDMRITELSDDDHGQADASFLNNTEYEEFTDEDEYYTEDEDGEDGAPVNGSMSTRLLASIKPGNLKRSLKGAGQDLAAKSWKAVKAAGNVAWIVTTSMILIGLPVLYAYDREKNTSAQSGQMLPLDATAPEA